MPADDRYTVANVSKVVPANWKVAFEALLESYDHEHCRLDRIAGVSRALDGALYVFGGAFAGAEGGVGGGAAEIVAG